MTEARSGALFFNLGVTLARVALAFVLAMTLGGAIGYLMGRVRLADRLGDPWLILLLNLPALVVIVLAYIWAGLTEAAAIAAIAINKLPTAVVTLREGTRALDPALDEMATRVCDSALEGVPSRRVAAARALYRGRCAIRACRWSGRSCWLPNCSAGRTASASRSAWPSSCSTSRVLLAYSLSFAAVVLVDRNRAGAAI